MRKIILNCRTANIDEFRKAAKLAAECGITHVVISQVEKSTWQWDMDRTDPYPNWGMKNASLFKIMVPDVLKKFIPEGYAERNLEIVKQRAEILKEYGLKAVFEGMEPAWMTEEVYREHPGWRGPRCDQPRRARKGYYAPCTDNPEVKALYEESVYKLCSIVPIELFRFLTNDSGGGICWSERLYPGSNGSSRCEHIPVAQKAVDFLSVIQEAAARAGVNAEAGFVRNFTAAETTAVVAKLKDGQFCYEHTNKETVKQRDVGWGEHQDATFPIDGIPQLLRFINQMAEFADDDECNIYYTVSSVNNKEYFELIKHANGKLRNSAIGKYEVLKATAADLIGEKYAEKLVDVWEHIHYAQDRLVYLNKGGHMFQLGTVHQRWLTRPLVAFPSELTKEEKAYYRDYIFQAGTEEEADNPINMQASIWLDGYSAHNIMERCCNHALSAVKKAISVIDTLLSEDIGEYSFDLKELKLKLRMYICVITNAKNVIHFQSIIDRTDYEAVPTDPSIANDEQGDRRLYKVDKIVRNEIENTQEMIEILDEAETPVLVCFGDGHEKDIMHFGNDVRDDFLKKIDIMETHKYDFTRLYKSRNM